MASNAESSSEEDNLDNSAGRVFIHQAENVHFVTTDCHDSNSREARLLEISEAHIDRDSQHFVETPAFGEATNILINTGVLILTGAPGAGKSTMARALLRHFRDMAYRPLVVRFLDDYYLCCSPKRKRKRVILLLFESQIKPKAVKPFLNTFQEAKKNAARDIPIFTIFIIKPQILPDIQNHLQFLKSFVLDLNMQSSLSDDLKLNILRLLQNDYEQTQLDTILDKSRECRFLFPWCCRQYINDKKRLGAQAFEIFSNFSTAYVESISEMFYSRGNKLKHIHQISDVMLQLKCLEERFGSDAKLKDIPRKEVKSFLMNDFGAFVSANCAAFPCRVSYDALGLVLGRIFALPELLKVCDIQFLTHHFRTKINPHTKEQAHYIYIETDKEYSLMAERILEELLSGKLAELCQFKCFCDEYLLMEVDKLRQKKGIPNHVLSTVNDMHSQKSFVYWSLWGPTPHLTRWMLKHLDANNISMAMLQDIFFAAIVLGTGNIDIKLIKDIFSKENKNSSQSKSDPQKYHLPFGPMKCLMHVPTVKERFNQLQGLTAQYTKQVKTDIPQGILRVDTTQEDVTVSSHCRSWYLALRLLDDLAFDEVDHDGETLLYEAAEAGDLEIVQFLTSQGATYIPMTSCILSPFVAAVERGHRAVAEFLAQRGHDLTTLCGGAGELYKLCDRFGKDAWFRGLQRNKSARDVHVAEIEARNGHHQLHQHAVEGPSLLHIATLKSNRHVVKLSLDWATSVDATWQAFDGKTALHISCEKGDSQTVDLLLQAGADVNVRDVKKRTPLWLACEAPAVFYLNVSTLKEISLISTHKEIIVRKLLSRKADVNAHDVNGRTPLYVICQRPPERSQEVIADLLITAGAQV